ncbi:hypothetical protein [Paraburkholderia sp. C35]|uniref:hypothetical protein n=1 Tax=Paraburkholderia sp. C35 TaxID=2126993 RepID=UPI0019521F8B|nr:hypothetical protein [Paraburkholderia sp. C35]
MGTKTGKITYNVHDRGRNFTGKDREFNLPALSALVNGREVQEKVRNRDLTGFYGHWIRARFGLTPPESVVFDGRMVNIEPAFVTTHLECDDKGNITHEAEFLDTDSGSIAERLFSSKQGGFSSAIHTLPRLSPSVPDIFAGFDYVFEPNYTTNRGYMFDSAAFDDQTFLDSVVQEWQLSNAMMRTLFDSMQADSALMMQTIERLQEENAELMSIASRVPGNGTTLLDSTGGFVAPLSVSSSATAEFRARARSFSTGTLVELEALPDEQEAAATESPARSLARRAWGA